MKCLESVEMCTRRMLEWISWTERIRNKEVLNTFYEEKENWWMSSENDTDKLVRHNTGTVKKIIPDLPRRLAHARHPSHHLEAERTLCNS